MGGFGGFGGVSWGHCKGGRREVSGLGQGLGVLGLGGFWGGFGESRGFLGVFGGSTQGFMVLKLRVYVELPSSLPQVLQP